MRLSQPLTRAIVSLTFVIALALLFAVPKGSAPVQARPLQQAAVTLTVDDDTKFVDAGNAVVYNFTLTNNSGAQQSFSVGVSNSNFNPQFQSPITVAPGGTVSFTVRFTPDPDTAPGTRDLATVSVTGNSGTPPPQASIVVTTTVTVNGQTPTSTPPATRTTTPTGTTGPSPTQGPLCRDRYEPNSTLGEAREIRPDEPQTHAICPAGDEDFLFFGGIAGKVYTIDVSDMASGLDLSLKLYDANGNVLAFNDDFPRTNDPADPANIRPRIQSYRIPANGRYYVQVRDNAGRGGTNLEYTVELQSESYGPTPTLVSELCTDLFEPDGVPEQARLVVIREVQPNHKFCPAGDADWVRFFAKAGERYVLRVDSSSRAGADPFLVLVDRDGASILDANDDSNGTLDPRIEFQVEVDGFYYAQLKNIGDIGNQFIAYDFAFEPAGASGQPAQPTTTATTTTATTETTTETTTQTTTTTATTGTPGTATPTIGVLVNDQGTPYPAPSQTALVGATLTARAGDNSTDSVKGAPAFVNGQSKEFVDPALKQVWSRTDQVVAARNVDRSWMWGPAGLVARAEVYSQSNGGVRQVQYFDKARMEITNWLRDRNNPWFVTNGLLVKELIEGRLQIGDSEFVQRAPANIAVAGDADDPSGPTYASFAGLLGRVDDQTGQTATATLRRDGSTGSTAARAEARLVRYVPETGHNIPQVFWDFLNARGPVGDGSQTDVLVDWVFAMGYPVSEPYWTKVKVGGVERDVLVQAFQRRVLTYTPANPAGWQVEMGNVGRHYYWWRYGKQP